jgi:hypothetical protein
MKIRTDNPLTVDKSKSAPSAATVGEHSPTPLAEGELDHIAAAGSKPGVAGGDTRT